MCLISSFSHGKLHRHTNGGIPADASDQNMQGVEVTFILLGDLTIHGVTLEMPFEGTILIDGDTLFGTATSRLKMTDFGIDSPRMLDFVVVEDEVELTINNVAIDINALNQLITGQFNN
jgi:hypothetical protein